MRLVRNARRAWKWFSMQAMVLAGALQGGWQMLPDDLRSNVPDGLATVLTMVILVAGIVGRLVDQGDG